MLCICFLIALFFFFFPSTLLNQHFPSQADMKMTYPELSVIGRLRKISMCGPFSMFCKLIHLWRDLLSPVEVGVLLSLSFELPISLQ